VRYILFFEPTIPEIWMLLC